MCRKQSTAKRLVNDMSTMKITTEVVIPEDATWIAQDSDGAWYWYEVKPYIVTGDSWWRAKTGRSVEAYTANPPKDFTQELYEIVWE